MSRQLIPYPVGSTEISYPEEDFNEVGIVETRSNLTPEVVIYLIHAARGAPYGEAEIEDVVSTGWLSSRRRRVRVRVR